MANPYFERNEVFNQPRGNTMAPVPPVDASQFEQIQQSYYAPAAGSFHTGRMTFDDVINKSAVVIGTVIAVALGTAFLVPDALLLPAMFIGALGGLVLGLVNSFKREPSPGLIMGYAVLEGMFLGGISKFFETVNPGIVWQATLGTAITFVVTLTLFRSGRVRVTPKFTRFLLIAMVSYLVFGLVNIGVMLLAPEVGAFGLRSAASPIMGLPWGVIIGVIAIGLAAMTLITDFDSITRGVQAGVPRKYAWSAGFGLAVSLIWLYLEFLRLLSLLRGDD